MKILVAYASRHGSTKDISDSIAQILSEQGHRTEAIDAGQVTDISKYDGIILGSGVYMGRWLKPSLKFIENFKDQIKTKPTWLFSSGPLGDPPEPKNGNEQQIQALLSATKARDHQTFNGRIQKNKLGLAEKMIVKAVKAPEGDFRDWKEIRDWAEQIAESIAKSPISNN
jgi:menaquinone-dependent protoporphyrinogen oxidase